MKYLITLIFLAVFSVTILLYLLSLGNFLPENINGEYSVLNVTIFSALCLTVVFSFISLLAYLFLLFILKKENAELISAKFSILVTVGVFLVFLLNFLHILDVYWD
jgi:hypothetical protein